MHVCHERQSAAWHFTELTPIIHIMYMPSYFIPKDTHKTVNVFCLHSAVNKTLSGKMLIRILYLFFFVLFCF